MYVVATAGHVDHGKSTLMRALTGRDPDRWAEEKRRGLTIDLGFVWTTLDSGRNVAFVDVPGHERFVGNMLAGLAPTDTVLFVVAADEGWQQQSTDHFAAVRALGISHGLVALTRVDRASQQQVAATRAEVAQQLSDTALADAPIVEVSAITGTGFDDLRAALDRVLEAQGDPAPGSPVRLWLDRSFSITGAGTVVTGTLAAGTIRVGDELEVAGKDFSGAVTVRGLQSEEIDRGRVGPVNRVAVNLRGVGSGALHRGDALVTPGRWWRTQTIDARATDELPRLPRELAAHVGTAEVTARVRVFDAYYLRLILPRQLPLCRGDRLVLRAPGGHEVLAGVEVVDCDPPRLAGHGAGKRRAAFLRRLNRLGAPAEVARRGGIRRSDLDRMGWRLLADLNSAGLVEYRGWIVAASTLEGWAKQLIQAVAESPALNPGISRNAAIDLLGLPDPALLPVVMDHAGLELREARILAPDQKVNLGAAEEGIAQIESWLGREPFRAPEANELLDLGLGAAELAAAERAGRIVRLGERRDVVLLVDAPAVARNRLAGIEQPFTLSQARRALGTTRRVAVPLLEHLDALGVTRRLDAHMRVLR